MVPLPGIVCVGDQPRTVGSSIPKIIATWAVTVAGVVSTFSGPSGWTA